MSCHKKMQAETCRVLLPMALEVSALRNAIFAFSLAQRASQEEAESFRNLLTTRSASLRTTSIGQLHQQITLEGESRPETVLATCIMLCLSALCHDNPDYNSWRTHLQGARAVVPTIRAARQGSTTLDESVYFLERRYSLLQVVASLTPNGFQAQDLDRGLCITSLQPSQVFFDDYCGCYPDVLDMLRQIGAALWERRRLNQGCSDPMVLSEADLESETTDLENRLLAMLERDEITPPSFAPGLEEIIDQKQAQEFAYCNLICEYAALIQLRAELRGLGSEDLAVCQSVKRIIRLAQQLEPPSGLSPALGLNTSLYTAGRYASGEDRTAIQELLARFYQTSHNYNMIHTLRFLDLIWKRVDSGQLNIQGTSGAAHLIQIVWKLTIARLTRQGFHRLVNSIKSDLEALSKFATSRAKA